MLPHIRNYDELCRQFRWQVPARYNIGVDVCDRWAQSDPDRLALVNLLADGTREEIRYGWLKPFSELILAFEEDEEERAPAEELHERTRDLLLPPQEKTPFGRRYLSLMQREPALVLAQGKLARLLR